jgi:hypothetical protein
MTAVFPPDPRQIQNFRKPTSTKCSWRDQVRKLRNVFPIIGNEKSRQFRMSNEQGSAVKPKSCRGCIESSDSTGEMVEVLNNGTSECASCPHEPVIRNVNEQFRMKRPRWWLVNGEVVVPVWLVERVKKSPRS